jgi:hypothetical protein
LNEDLEEQVDQFRQMTMPELRRRYAELFGDTTRVGNRDWLCKRLAWRLQALAEGDLSDRARRRAEELACDADLRLSPPRRARPNPVELPQQLPTRQVTTPTAKVRTDTRLPPPGTILVRSYKGQSIRVKVLTNGFECQGGHFDSLSAVAKAITGSHCNGLYFFRLNSRKKVSS